MPAILAFTDTIFLSLKFFIPLLVLLKFSKILIKGIDIKTLVNATNCLLLLAGLTYLIVLTSEIFVAYYSQNEYEQYTVSNRIFGPYWFEFAIQAFVYMLLPQMMWFKKARTSVIATIIWGVFAYALAAIVFYAEYSGYRTGFSPSIAFLAYAKSLTIFILLLALAYFIVLKGSDYMLLKKRA